MGNLRSKKKVVIVGAGFGGLKVAQILGKYSDYIDITIIDRRNHHLFQPLLYQVALAAISPTEIASPIRGILSKYKNVEVLMENITKVDIQNKVIHTTFKNIDYDYLVMACGSNHSYFGKDHFESFAPGLKSIEEANEILRRVLMAFEMAEMIKDEATRKKFLTFVIIGGGPTGVELAGAIAEMAKYTLAKNFRHIDTRHTNIVMLEAGTRILQSFHPKSSAHAQKSLEKLGVTVRTGCLVNDIDHNGVYIKDEFIPARTVIWAAGVAPAEINHSLGVPLSPRGSVIVEKDLSIKDHPNFFVIGDQCYFEHYGSPPLPGLAPVATQMGAHVAKNIIREVKKKKRLDFHYFNKGSMATIGRAMAVAEYKKLRLTGYPAWFLWLFVHIYYLIGFKNRLITILHWFMSYLTYLRGARVIVSRHWKMNTRNDLAKRFIEVYENPYLDKSKPNKPKEG